MRILHVVPSYVPAWRYGGPIRSVHGLCRSLSRAGNEVHVYTTNADGPANLDVPVGTPVDVEGVNVWYFQDRLRRVYWSPSMVRALARTAAGFDVIHLHSIYLWPTTAGARAARRWGVPYVVSPRGMLMGELIRGKSRWVKMAWIRAFERSNLAHAAAAHFTSSNEAEQAQALGLSFKRVWVIPNGSDADEDVVAGDKARSAAAASRDSSPFVLFIGRISWEKGLDRLVAALPFAPGCRLVIAGESADAQFKSRLESQARQCGVADRIEFVGAIHGPRKAELLRSASALVLPSYSESFGNVVLEAMAASCPVVVTPEVGAAEVVREAGAGVVLEGTPRKLGEGIRALLDDPRSRAMMGARGQAAFAATYTWPAVARRMLDAYSRIAGQAP